MDGRQKLPAWLRYKDHSFVSGLKNQAELTNKNQAFSSLAEFTTSFKLKACQINTEYSIFYHDNYEHSMH